MSYGTLSKANAFFLQRLHNYDWDISTVEDRQKAMNQATELIDQFDYIGQKYTVQVVCDSIDDASGDKTTDASQLALRDAEEAQELEFPRGDSSTIPTEIETACYLIAKALLSGRDPDADLESLSVKSAAYGGVRTAYDRTGNTQEHMAHLIPSPQAFNLIRPFFRERNLFDVKRVP
jgi:hypothetical protein